MDLFDKRALKTKKVKKISKNVFNAIAIYDEYRELLEEDPDYVTFTLPLLEGILDD
jgi:hypothetical protein